MMPRLIKVLLSSGLVFFWACDGGGSSDPGPKPGQSGQPGSNHGGGDWPSGPGVSDGTGVDTNEAPGNDTTPNASCDQNEVDHTEYGSTYEGGAIVTPTTQYTCNKCPGGLKMLQGSWRVHGYDGEGDDDYGEGSDARSDDAELLVVDGNTYYVKHSVTRSGSTMTFEQRGWYFCSQKPEHQNEHLFWTITDVVQDDWKQDKVGDILRTDVILADGTDKILIYWFDDLTSNKSVDYGYCRLGSKDPKGTLCNDPFSR